MSGLPEIATWEPTIYQIEDADYAAGGPDGHPNVSMRQLANRTAWLKKKVESATQTLRLVDSDGVTHNMVWIPRFTLPAGAISAGVPSRDLDLGGFVVDQFHSTVSGGAKAVCIPLQAPATGMSAAEAGTYAAARVIGGAACHVMTMREYGHLCWLVAFLGHDLRGNLYDGRDARDDDEWPFYGLPMGETAGMTAGGTGPISWAHNGLADGVFDLLGNAEQILSGHTFYAGCIEMRYLGKLAAGIDADDADFVVIDPSTRQPSRFFDHWPLEDGQIFLTRVDELMVWHTERMVYQERVAVGGHPEQMTLVGCLRGYHDTDAEAWEADQEVWCVKYHNLIPDGYTAFVAGNGLDNTTPGQATFGFHYGFLETGERGGEPALNDVLLCGEEQLRIDQIVGTNITVTRGVNGTVIAAHAENALVSRIPSSAKMWASYGRIYGSAVGAPRSHEDLEELYLPADSVYPAPVDGTPQNRFELYLGGLGGTPTRGGHYNVHAVESVMRFLTQGSGDVPNAATGFRSALTPE